MREISIHRLGHIVGTHISKKMDIPNKANLLGYGAEVLIGGIVKLTVLFLVSILLGILVEVALLLLVVAIMRTLSGGAHCSAYYRCMVTSIFVLGVLGYIIKTMYPSLSVLPPIVLGGIILLSIYLYWCYAPQAPPNKPFKTKAAETAFRRYTLITAATMALIAILAGVESLISWIIAGGLLWQAFTLTPAGYRFIRLIDVLLSLKVKEVTENDEDINKIHV